MLAALLAMLQVHCC